MKPDKLEIAVADRLGEWPPYGKRPPELLHVEDFAEILLVYRVFFERFGFVAHEAVNGNEALEKLPLLKPDLVILDISLPGVDGWSIAEWVRRHPSLRSMPIMGLSAHAMKLDHEKAGALGFDAYLTKAAMPAQVMLTAAECIVGGWKRGYRARAGE
jgi:two-component system cell cycle response regulator DivK